MSDYNAGSIFSVPGLVAVVTGGGSGIGLMITKAFALNGAHKVYIIGRRKEVLEAAAKESPHGNIIPVIGDVTSKQSLQAAVDHIKADAGYINILIANSGVMGPRTEKKIPEIKSIEEFQTQMWAQNFDEFTNTFHVNVTAQFFTAIAFLGLLDAGNKQKNVEQQSQVIATSSIAGHNKQVPASFAYGLSKTACTQLVKQLSTTLIPYDIRANAILPGLFPSELAAPIIGAGPIPRERIPLQRIGTEEDMAGTILYLASRAGAYNNGAVIVVDGGRLSQLPSTL